MRLFLKIFIGLLLVLVVVLAIVLVPAHRQIRSVEPPLPSKADLRALAVTPNGPTQIRYINTSSQALPWGELGHTVFLVEWANGNRFMIDAGMDRDAAIEFGRLMESVLGAEEARSHGSIDQLLGEETMKVMGVAFTHLHIDHTQGVIPFCEARGPGASVYQTPWQSELQNFNTTEAAEIIASSCLARGRIRGGPLARIDGFPGLGIAGLGGHTPGSTLFAVAVGDRIWLLSGDISNSKADLLNDIGKEFLYSYFMVPEHTGRTETLRRWLADLDAETDMTVLVSHDLGDIRASGMGEYDRSTDSD